MQKTVIINAHVISPGVDLKNATIVIEGKKIREVKGAGCRVQGAECRVQGAECQGCYRR